MMVTADQCRTYAAQCRRLAQSGARQLQTTLCDLAREWDVIAEQMARQEQRETGAEKVLDLR